MQRVLDVGVTSLDFTKYFRTDIKMSGVKRFKYFD